MRLEAFRDLSRRFAAPLAIGIVVIVSAPRATAAPSETDPGRDLTPTARTLSDTALKQYQSGDYDAAIESFLSSFALSNNPGLLFNIGQSYRLKGDCLQAREYYGRYLAAVPSSKLRDTVEQRIREMQACVESKKAESAPPPKPRRQELAAPKPEASASPALSLTVRPAARPTPPFWRRPAFVASASAAVVLAGAGAYFAGTAHQAGESLSARYRQGGQWDGTAQSDYQTGQRAQTLGIVSFAAAGAAGLAAAWFAFTY